MAKKKLDISKLGKVDETHVKAIKEDETLNRGPKRKIPKSWKGKLVRLNPDTVDRIDRVKYEAKRQKNDDYKLQDLILNEAIKIGLNTIEKQLKIK